MIVNRRTLADYRQTKLEVVVNTYERTDLAVGTLKSIRTSALDDVWLVVVDDGSRDLKALCSFADELVQLRHVGAGRARRLAMLNALARSKPDHVLFCDSDLVFSTGFDRKTVELIDVGDSLVPWRVASPYRSTSHLDGDQPFGLGCVLGHTYGGATIGVRRARLRNLVNLNVKWDLLYDWKLCNKIKAVKPTKSLADHLGGLRPDGLHPGSWDCGVNFYC